MSNRIWLLVAVLFFASAEGNPGGPIYKWTDKDGIVHFTDCPPPPGCKAETLEAQKAPSAADIEKAQQRLETLLTGQEQSAAEREQERLQRQAQEAAALQIAVDRKRTCILAQQNLHALVQERPVYYINEKGDYVFLDETTHKAEIERMQQLIQDYCSQEK